MKKLAGVIGVSLFAALAAQTVSAQATCKNRGELDTNYCDENGDLVADLPKDPKRWKNPSTLVWAYTPVEDPAVYEKIFAPFTAHLSKCTDKKVVFFQVQSNAAEIEAMRSGLNGANGLCGERRWRDSIRREGLRERFSGLQPDCHYQSGGQHSHHCGLEGQEGRAYVAVVQ
jgi:hypothetical protein